MIKHEFREHEGILIIEPIASLHSNDFDLVSTVIDPYIEQNGNLNGVIIHTGSFPGWEDFASMLAHIKFVKDHHDVINKVAVVTDDGIASVMPAIADRFVKAEVRHFPYNDLDKAVEWAQAS